MASKKRWRENKEKLSIQHKNWVEKNIEKRNAYNRDYYLKNIEKTRTIPYRENKSKYQKEHHIQINKQRAERRLNDVQFKLSTNLRSRLYSAIMGTSKEGSAVRDLGCTVLELKMYLEGQFKDGMTWNNWSLRGWHIDHKVPLAFFDLSNRKQLLQAFHYTNLQPLWATENLVKNKSYVV